MSAFIVCKCFFYLFLQLLCNSFSFGVVLSSFFLCEFVSMDVRLF